MMQLDVTGWIVSREHHAIEGDRRARAWFRALVGTFEVLGGILLFVPVTPPFGSVILGTIMVGAVWVHVAAGEFARHHLVRPAAPHHSDAHHDR